MGGTVALELLPEVLTPRAGVLPQCPRAPAQSTAFPGAKRASDALAGSFQLVTAAPRGRVTVPALQATGTESGKAVRRKSQSWPVQPTGYEIRSTRRPR